MKKYWTIFKLTLQNEMQYRFNFFISILGNGITLIFFFFFWFRIYSEGNQIGNYDLKGLLTYYFVSTIWIFLLYQNVGWLISDEIREGQLNIFLLKPYNYLLNHLTQYWSVFLSHFIYYVPVILILFIFLQKFFIYPQNFGQWIFFVSSFILASFLYFFIHFCIGLLSFWLGMIMSFNYGLTIFMSFMGGQYLPIDLFPNWLKFINQFLPFRYMIFEPVSIFLNRIPFNLLSLLVPFIWAIVLFAVSLFAWKRGIRVYEAYGA